MNSWKWTTLGELVKSDGGFIQTGPFGSQLHAADYVENGIPCIMPTNLKNNKISLEGVARITESDAFRLKRHLVKTGDIIYSRRGDVTLKALVTEADNGFFCGTGCLLVRPGNKVNSQFLVYFLSIQSSVKWILSQVVGATMPNLNTKILARFPLQLPPLNDQAKIAKVLSDLDAKIDLNNRINSELEGMAKLIYDYWFVQFDFPISAAQAAAMGRPELQGKPYKSSGGKMVFNEELKRDVPEGWGLVPLTKEMDLQYGYPFSTKKFTDNPQDKPVIRIRDIKTNSISIFSSEEVDEKYLLEKGDLIIGMDGNFHMNFWERENCWINQRSLRIRMRAKSRCSIFSCFFQIEPYIKAREKNVSRTTVGHLSAKDINGLKLLVPDDKAGLSDISFFESILKKVIVNRNENQTLSELRDWLLPMLMNGQVRVMGEEGEVKMAAEPGEEYQRNKSSDYDT